MLNAPESYPRQTEHLPDGIYLVHWTHNEIPLEGREAIQSQLVRANRFGDVEDWADANVADGYALATIEKQYAYRDLYESQEPDVVLAARWGGGHTYVTPNSSSTRKES